MILKLQTESAARHALHMHPNTNGVLQYAMAKQQLTEQYFQISKADMKQGFCRLYKSICACQVGKQLLLLYVDQQPELEQSSLACLSTFSVVTF